MKSQFLTESPPFGAVPLHLGRKHSSESAARICGVSLRTIRDWRRRGVGPAFVRLSSTCIRYPEAELKRFLESRLVRPSAEVQQ